LLTPRRLAELFERHGVRPRKALGQNFVIDPNTIRKVVNISDVRRGDRVLEIGAGAGSLTLALAAAATHVTAVEFDDRLLPVLTEVLAGCDNVEIVHADALTLALGALESTKVVGNLPYNIAATLVLRILEEASQIAEMTVMTQREVGERLVATPGSKAYGLTSVLVTFRARAEIAGRVSRRAFYPVPQVDSVVVRLVRRPSPAPVAGDRLAAVVRASFSQRRKRLRNALAPLAGSTEAAEAALEQADIDPGARAEQIALDGFVRLAKALP
jgi:16S rRNA (adenine1518-N6/adenine1519-N6)-dimethyltransferase